MTLILKKRYACIKSAHLAYVIYIVQLHLIDNFYSKIEEIKKKKAIWVIERFLHPDRH